MLHFSNQELAENYHISVRTVRNWIDAAKDGKLDLVLHEQGKRTFIANTSKNVAIIKQLTEKNKKYRPLKTHKIVSPRPEFYEIYTEAQIYDLVSNLEIYHEIPQQYNYFGSGAEDWSAYVERLAKEDNPNTLNATIKLLEMDQSYIDAILQSYKYVNVIDIGAGNALPVRGFLNHLLDIGKLNRYIAIDISQTMLDIVKHNVDEWFDGQIQAEGVQLDISHDRFIDILAEEYIKKESKDTINVMLLFGGTLGIFRSMEGTLRVIHESMGANDLLFYGKKLDSASTRRYFDFNTAPGDTALAPIFGYVVNLLAIDRSLYEVDMGYDSRRRERYERIRFKGAVSINFKFQKGERTIHLNKNDSLLVWRAPQQSCIDVLEQFNDNGFYPLHMSQTDDQEYLLGIMRIKRD